MGRAIDQAGIQFRMLNKSVGLQFMASCPGEIGPCTELLFKILLLNMIISESLRLPLVIFW